MPGTGSSMKVVSGIWGIKQFQPPLDRGSQAAILLGAQNSKMYSCGRVVSIERSSAAPMKPSLHREPYGLVISQLAAAGVKQ